MLKRPAWTIVLGGPFCAWASALQLILYVLPPQQFTGYVAIELLAIAITEGKDHLVVESNARAVHLQEVSHVDDVRLMNAQEVVGREAFLQFLHAEEHHQGLVSAIRLASL